MGHYCSQNFMGCKRRWCCVWWRGGGGALYMGIWPQWDPYYNLFIILKTLKADSHIACRAHAVPLPCRGAKGLECVFPIWFTQCGHVLFTLAMPRSDHAPLLKATAQCRRRETACGRTALYRLLPATTRSSREVVIRSKPISVAVGQCETKQRLSCTDTHFKINMLCVVITLLLACPSSSYCFQLPGDWFNIFKVLSVLFPCTHGFFTSTSAVTAKCCDVRELW
jgi:hypothetical protein